MTPNQITVLRVLAACIAVALFDFGALAALAGVALTITAIVLDAVDGWVARRRNLATPIGAQFDILGDRVVENLYFVYFAAIRLIPVWVPIFFFARGLLTDFFRSIAAGEGRVGFGKNSMLETWWGKALVASRWSRGAYGALKCVCFCYLGLMLALAAAASSGVLASFAEEWNVAIHAGGQFLVYSAVAFCLLRGLPVLWEGRRYVMTSPAPKAALAGTYSNAGVAVLPPPVRLTPQKRVLRAKGAAS